MLKEQVQRLNTESVTQINRFYDERNFPIAVRSIYAKEIERAVCGDRDTFDSVQTGWDPSNPLHQLWISNFISVLIQNIERKLTGSRDPFPFILAPKIAEVLPHLKAIDPLQLFKTIRDCIQFEISLVKDQAPGNKPKDVIMNNIANLKRKITYNGDLLRKLDSEQRAFQINCNQKHSIDDCQANSELYEMHRQRIEIVTRIEGNIQILLTLMQEFKDRAFQNIHELSELQTIVNQNVVQWKYQQQLQMNVLVRNETISLEKLQIICEELAGLLWTSVQHLRECERLKNQNPAVDNGDHATGGMIEDLIRLLRELINFCFIVENQPPQVMKKGTRFPSPLTVSLLVGTKLNIQMTCPQVSTCIITESQARTLPVSDIIDVAGVIVNGNTKFEYNKDSKRLVANFRSIQLKNIKRADKKNGAINESVMEEKFCLHFQSFVDVGDIKIKIQTLSLPVVVTSHGSQEAQAVATVVWDNAFGELGRIPFQVPNKVSWAEVSQLLSNKFFQSTGRGLTKENLKYLKAKAFRNSSHSDFISWTEFCKDHLPDRTFSFWEWFYSALRVIEKKETHLKEIWKEGLIMGFVDREYAQGLLACNQPPGSFLLRFSDSLLGAITIAWVHDDGIVHSVEPFDLAKLQIKKLADSIRELVSLKFLYPNRPRDVAFEKFFSNSTSSKFPGYEPLITHLVPGEVPSLNGNRSRSSSSPQVWDSMTSQDYFPHNSPYYNLTCQTDNSMDTSSSPKSTFVMQSPDADAVQIPDFYQLLKPTSPRVETNTNNTVGMALDRAEVLEDLDDIRDFIQQEGFGQLGDFVNL